MGEDQSEKTQQPRPPLVRRPVAVKGNYQLLKTIGSGVFGKVKEALHLPTGSKVAVKIFHKSRFDENSLEMIRREISIMKKMYHTNIVKLYEVIETGRYIFLVMELLGGGELMNLINMGGPLSEDSARKYFREIIAAIDYCHSNHVIHLDLKPENMLLDSKLNLKLIDFGLSNTYEPGQLLTTFCGSPSFSAPELGPIVDIWSLGVVLYVMVTGKLPFDGDTYLEMYQKILAGNYEIPAEASADCRDLLRRILVVDPKQRATLDQIQDHVWVQENGVTVPKSKSLTEDVDPTLLQRMALLNFDVEATTKSVLEKSYDTAYATYWILRLDPKPLEEEQKSNNFTPEKPKIAVFSKDTPKIQRIHIPTPIIKISKVNDNSTLNATEKSASPFLRDNTPGTRKKRRRAGSVNFNSSNKRLRKSFEDDVSS
eukprot:TRINITY_DN9141_c0_g1_i1.p1 TRINITY_DN9141_c0_g1~~TRINITY_DN9141_c0_g1_i1.p1  ORF type:complete len:427 (+),score=67.58 TRINITY_DN9141_c0_g1_i1:71-1351(+)